MKPVRQWIDGFFRLFYLSLVVISSLSGQLSFAKPCAINLACFESILDASSHPARRWADGIGVSSFDGDIANWAVIVNGKRSKVSGYSFVQPVLKGKSVVDPRTLFQDGNNHFVMTFTGLYLTNVTYRLNYYAPNVAHPKLICAGFLKNDTVNHQDCGNVQMNLVEFDAGLARQIEAIKAEIRGHQARGKLPTAEELSAKADQTRYQQERAGIERHLAALNRELENINFGDFDRIRPSQLAALIAEEPRIRTLYDELKNGIDQLKNTIQSELADNRQKVAEISEFLKSAFGGAADFNGGAQFGFESPQNSNPPPSFDSTPPEGGFQPSAGASSSLHPFELFTRQTMTKLDGALSQGDRNQFRAVFSSWSIMQENTLRELETCQVQLATLQILRESQSRVMDYVKHQMDEYGFFRAAKIPERTKKTIHGILKRWSETASRDLLDELNGWQEDLTPAQTAILREIDFVDTVLTQYFDPRFKADGGKSPQELEARSIAEDALKLGIETLIQAAHIASTDQAQSSHSSSNAVGSESLDQASAEFQEMMEQIHASLHAAQIMANIVLGMIPIVGPVKDLYEAFSGKNALSGEALTLNERIISTAFGVIGLATGGASNALFKGPLKVLAKIGKAGHKSHGAQAAARDTEKVVDSVSKIFDSAGKVQKFHPLSHGPLHLLKEGAGTIADTFRSSTYLEIVAKEPIKLYRIYGGNAGPLGRYWSRIRPTGPYQAVLDSALDPSWGNSAKHWIEVTVPAGTKFYEGIVSEMFLKMKGSNIEVGNLLGGGSQVYMTEKILDTWEVVKGTF